MKREIKKAIDNIVTDTIDVAHLPSEYQEGIKCMKREIVNYIHQLHPTSSQATSKQYLQMCFNMTLTDEECEKIKKLVELLKK